MNRRDKGKNRAKPFGTRVTSWSAVALIVLTSGCGKPQAPPKAPPVAVQAVQVKKTTLEHALTAVGSLSSPQETLVSPQISGSVVELHIEQGRQVKHGAVLARLDDDVQKAEVQAARAALADAEQIYKRDLQVKSTGGVSEQKLQTDRAGMRQARATLAQAEANLQYTVVMAPFTGVLGLRRVSLGAYLQPGDAIVGIRQLDPLHLDFDLPQEDLPQIAVNQVVRFSVAGIADIFEGKVNAIDTALSANTRAIHVQATVANPRFRLRPGMFANVHLIVSSTPNALMIPMQALVGGGSPGQHVWVVGAGDKSEMRDVTLGVYQDNWVRVLSGVREGERVVTAGVQKLRPNAQLIVQPYVPISNPRLQIKKPASGSAEARP